MPKGWPPEASPPLGGAEVESGFVAVVVELSDDVGAVELSEGVIVPELSLGAGGVSCFF
jgi:hypothetical protein